MRPIFVVGGLYSLANGVAWIMRDLAAALGRSGAPVEVYAADCWGRGAPSVGEIFQPPATWTARRGFWLGGLSWSPPLKSVIRQAVRNCDIVHQHSVWMLPNSYASRYADRLGKPVVLTAHGALEPWALRHSGWKKRLAGAWFQNRDLRSAACIHVNSRAEIAGIRALGLQQPVAVIPNGVDPLPVAAYEPETFLSRYPELRDCKLILYLARLHQKKGLAPLIEAWARLADEFSDWRLVLAGPDAGFEQAARDLVAARGLTRRVCFPGYLDSSLKASALAAASVFVQPSFSEGFSMSILEAMGASLPVLLSPGCNFPEAAQVGAAIEVAPEMDETARGLRGLLEMPDNQRKQMGQRGRRLVEEHYTWDSVAAKMMQLYYWLQGSRPQPDFILDTV